MPTLTGSSMVHSNEITMTAVEFKRLTPDNLISPDPWTLAFANCLDLASGETREMSRDEFLSHIFEPQLTAIVPQEVSSLLEGARAAMCYGYFFGSSPKSVMRDPHPQRTRSRACGRDDRFHRPAVHGTGSNGRPPQPCQIAAM